MISPRLLLLVVGALAVTSVLRAAAPEALKFEPIFNGKDLTGWTQPEGRGGKAAGPNLWRVENGVLIGESDKAQTGGTLRTEKTYRNFVLEFDVKYMPPADSGIGMRDGLQMQIGTSHSQWVELTGSFYQGALGYPDFADAETAWRYFYPGRWNTIRIDARGAIFLVSINGQIVNRYTDDKHPDAGPITVQVHSNEDMKIEFRNMKIADLDAGKPPAPAAAKKKKAAPASP
jgi:Domain of Unknown Function (DUF1080)